MWVCVIDSSTYLQRNDTLLFPLDLAQRRVDQLAVLLNHNATLLIEMRNARETSRVQLRGFYVAILTAILGVLFLGSGTRKEARRASLISKLALLVIGAMYLLEINMIDLTERDVPLLAQNALAVQSILAIAPDDSLWYSLDFTKAPKEYTQSFMLKERVLRKLKRAATPNGELIVFYFLPAFLIHFGGGWKFPRRGVRRN